ncbi:MAG: M56 family metallopeptidase [Pirellulaceae bacterium]
MNFWDLFLRHAVQVTLLAIVVGLLVRIFATDRPRLAHALWALVLLKCITPPLVSSPIGLFCWDSIWRTSNQVASVESNAATTKSVPWAPNRADAVVVRIPSGQAKTISPEATANDQQLSHVNDNSEAIAWSFLWRNGWMVWLGGAGLTAMWMSIRLTVFFRRVVRHRVATPDEVSRLVDRLRQTLGLRRSVRICTVNAAIGPAVVGLRRPTILLPSAILQGKSVKELEPLLAHELIHIQRGDLVWALVQTLATMFWWFHPLVRLAGRRLTAEAERSCDEQTILSLGCSPAIYAKSLLDVLEQKHKLHVAPALPGVRPVDITAKRLERIMRLRHGSHKTNSKWTAWLLLVGAAMTLPGAAWVNGQAEGDSNKPAQDRRTQDYPKTWTKIANAPGEESKLGLPSPVANDMSPVKSSDVTIVQMDATAALQMIQRDEQVDAEQAKVMLRAMLPFAGPNRNKKWPEVDVTVAQANSNDADSVTGKTLVLGGEHPSARFVENRLLALCDRSEETLVRDLVNRIAQHGTRQISVTTRIVTIPAEKLQTLDVKWSIMQDRTTGARVNRDAAISGNFILEGHVTVPTLVSTLEHSRARPLITELLNDSSTNMLMAPKVTVFNAQDATIQGTVERPFVVSVNEIKGDLATALQPVIQVIPEGLKLDVRPILNEAASHVQLDCSVRYDKITSVDEISFKHTSSSDGSGVTLQVPQVASQTMTLTDFELPIDSTLLIAGIQTREADRVEKRGKTIKGRQMVTMLIMQFEHIRPVPAADKEAANAANAPSQPAFVTIFGPAEPDHLEAICEKLDQAGVDEYRCQDGCVQVAVRYWQQGLAVVQQDRPTPNPAVVEDTIQRAHPGLVISADGEADRDYGPLIEALQAVNGIECVEVSGKIDFTIANDTVEFSGRHLKVSSGKDPEEFLIQADRGTIRFLYRDAEEAMMDWKFAGNAQVRSDELVASADEIRMDGVRAYFSGNVDFAYNQTKIKADRIEFEIESEQIRVGDATLYSPSKSGTP